MVSSADPTLPPPPSAAAAAAADDDDDADDADDDCAAFPTTAATTIADVAAIFGIACFSDHPGQSFASVLSRFADCLITSTFFR